MNLINICIQKEHSEILNEVSVPDKRSQDSELGFSQLYVAMSYLNCSYISI